MSTHKYTFNFYVSLFVAIGCVALCGISLSLYNSIHNFVKCFVYVNSRNTSSTLTYDNFCANSSVLDPILVSDPEFFDQDLIVTSRWSLIQSLNLGMNAVSCFFFGIISETYGRKIMFQFSLVTDIIGLGLILAFYSTGSFGFIVAGRCLNGLAVGGYTLNAPVYLQEIAVAQHKEKIGSLFATSFNTGTIIAQFLGLEFIFGSADQWIHGVHFTIALTGFLIFWSIFSVETPDWYAAKNDKQNRAASILKLHSIDVGDEEIPSDLIQQDQSKNPIAHYFQEMKNMMTDSAVGKITIMIMILIMLVYNLSGYTVLIIYSASIFSGQGFDNANSAYLTLGMTFAVILSTLVFMSQIEKMNKRWTLVVSFAILGIFNGLLATFGVIDPTGNKIPALNIVSAVVIYLAVILINFGLFQIPLLLSPMMIKPKYRTIANNLIITADWSSAWLVAFIFPYIYRGISANVFWIFGCICLGSSVWSFFRFSNPDGKNFDQIEVIFQKRKWL